MMTRTVTTWQMTGRLCPHLTVRQLPLAPHPHALPWRSRCMCCDCSGQRGLLSSKPGTPVRRQLSVETATTASSGQGCATGAGIGAGAGTAGAEDDSSGWEWEMSVGGGGDGHDDDLLDAFPQYGLNIDTLDGADDYATVGNRPRTVTNDTGDTGFTTETDDNDQEAGAVVPATPKRAATKYLYIQMEYCEGQTLREAIDEGALAAPPDVWRLFRQVYAVLCCVVLCCAVLCCVVLCVCAGVRVCGCGWRVAFSLTRVTWTADCGGPVIHPWARCDPPRHQAAQHLPGL